MLLFPTTEFVSNCMDEIYHYFSTVKDTLISSAVTFLIWCDLWRTGRDWGRGWG